MPYRFAREAVEARMIEQFHKGERVASHMRGSGNGRHTTTPDNMPSSHRRFADWTIERITRETEAIGPCAALLCEKILADRPHPEQGFRACLGIVRLVKSSGQPRVEAACSRALDIGARTYGSVKSILDKGLDRAADTGPATDRTSDWSVDHPNIRGPRYYH
ncbi:hypothetical protein GCM10007973_23300 [Polymorphobacter multimanifer]|uniref:Transposase n=1 Tax=Polymorphobacter multimanifer TaxID=1070431 RepID=A0A841L7A6_9SPHN|nr:transposase [Polymorphobacter multimanifer]GGI86051.1 hypothetical protein GCM10007973_23300 [Polymorphobacter multimanifer]